MYIFGYKYINTVVDDEWAVHEWTVMILMMMISWWTITRLMRITFIGESLIPPGKEVYQVQLLTRETETEKETANAHPQRIYIDTTQSRLMHHQLVHRTLED